MTPSPGKKAFAEEISSASGKYMQIGKYRGEIYPHNDINPGLECGQVNAAYEKAASAAVREGVDEALKKVLDSLRCPESEKRKWDEPEFNGFQSALDWAVGQVEILRNENSRAKAQEVK